MRDSQLLDDYVANNSETAFRSLVERYVNLVHSTALRQVRNPALTEEVAQAVFILLSRKAGSLVLKKELLLGGWLYRTTCFVAARALRGEQRRLRREQEAFQMQQDLSSPDDNWRHIMPLLDEGIGKLGQSNREAVILRFIQNQSLAEVGRNLGISEDAARKRITSAVEKLRTYFGRRGFTISGAVLAGVLAKNCAEAAPAALAKSIGSQVLANAAAASPALPVLVADTLAAWRNATLKLAAGIGIALVLVGFVVVQAVHHGLEGSPTPTIVTSAQSPALIQSPANSTPVALPASNRATPAPAYQLAFRAVDTQTSRGVPGAKITVVSAGDMKQVTSQPQNLDIQTNLLTDAEGQCLIPFAYSKPLVLAVGVLAEGYEERSFAWAGAMKGPDEPPPASYTLKLIHGSSIGGVVRDESGNPVAGAAIQIMFQQFRDLGGDESQQERTGLFDGALSAAHSDSSGKWIFTSAPASNGEFFIQVKHPAFPIATFYNDADGRDHPDVSLLKLDDLHARKAVLTLTSGSLLAGFVTDEVGSPIANASVNSAEHLPNPEAEVKTGPDGSFLLSHLDRRDGHLTVVAEGFAPQRIPVQFGSNTAPVTVRLKSGGLLQLLVVDTNGAPINQASVVLEDWYGLGTLQWESLSDERGVVTWSSAPQEPFTVNITKQGFESARDIRVKANGQTNTVTLRSAIKISGHVVDARTKLPISSFRVFPGKDRFQSVNGTNGEFGLSRSELKNGITLRVEADGYEPAAWPPDEDYPGNLPIRIELKQLGPKSGVRGVVLLSDGSPASGVQVALHTLHGDVHLGRGKFLGPDNIKAVLTDGGGAFSFSPEPGALSVVAVSAAGFANLPVSKDGSGLTVRLQPWGRVEGVVHLRTGSNARRDVMILDSDWPNGMGLYFDLATYSAKSDDNGNFVFDQVPPGGLRLYIMEGLGKINSHETPVQVECGRTARVQIGGSGALISGKLVCPDPQQSADWPKRLLMPMLCTRVPFPQGLGLMERAKWYGDFQKTDEGRAFLQSRRAFPLEVGRDGSFLVEDVPPGNYEITGSLSDTAVDISRSIMGRTIGSFSQNIDLTNNDPATINVGAVSIQMIKK